MTPEQIAYVKAELEKGVTPDMLRSAMLQNGYTGDQVDRLITAAQTNAPLSVSYDSDSSSSWVFIVIAIVVGTFLVIAVLAAVVLSSLNSARDKGADAAIKANLNNFRAQAEIHYDLEGGTYEGFCASNAFDYNCADSETAYRVISKELNGGGYYCVDSTGAAEELPLPPRVGMSCI